MNLTQTPLCDLVGTPPNQPSSIPLFFIQITLLNRSGDHVVAVQPLAQVDLSAARCAEGEKSAVCRHGFAADGAW